MGQPGHFLPPAGVPLHHEQADLAEYQELRQLQREEQFQFQMRQEAEMSEFMRRQEEEASSFHQLKFEMLALFLYQNLKFRLQNL